MRLCAASFLAVVMTMTTTACTPAAAPSPPVQQPAQQSPATPGRDDRVVSSGDELSEDEADEASDEAAGRERTVVVETEIFILTEGVEGLLPEDPDVPYTVEFGDCLAPPDQDGCCWVELTACPAGASDPGTAVDGESTESPGNQGCRSRRAHGCRG